MKYKILSAIGLLMLTPIWASAATFTGSSWTEGEVTFNVDFANSAGDPTVSGSPDFDAAFIQAANLWSNNSSFRFNIDTSSAVDPCTQATSSTLNGVRFSATSCGVNFQSNTTLAVARTFSSGGNSVRTGIIFNTAFTWGVYSGNLQNSVQDFRRVAVHELGHSLGLDHETRFPAIMQPSVSSTIETPQADDVGGVASLYDSDGDNIGLFEDNCPDTANESQTNTDGPADNLGDACDPDIDNDGIFNSTGVDQQLALNAANNSFFTLEGSSMFAQTFTSNIDGAITQIRLPVSCESGDLEIKLVGLLNGSLDVTDPIVDSVTLDSNINGSSSNFLTIEFGDAQNAHTTHAGEELAIILSTTGSCRWFTAPSGIYTGGNALILSGNIWFPFNNDSNVDFPFATIVEPTTLDNCPLISNQDQADLDIDEQGDVCDNDDDGDNVDDDDDNCPREVNTDQSNIDEDELGDACDTVDDRDEDGDGSVKQFDSNDDDPLICSDTDADSCDDCSQGQFDPSNDGVDTDSNGQCNLSDPDDDGDSVLDENDNCPLVANPEQTDTNLDELGDACDITDQDADEFCVPVKTRNGAVSLICL